MTTRPPATAAATSSSSASDTPTNAATNPTNGPLGSQRSLTKAEEDEIKYAFQLFDAEGKGVIPVQALRAAMAGIDPDKAKQLVESLPSDGNLTLQDFTALLTRRKDEEAAADNLEGVFHLFDTERKGYITVDDLKRVAGELGESMTEEELKEMIYRAESNETGQVSLEDFKGIMTRKLFS